jgi:high-affinity nickel-transport protein
VSLRTTHPRTVNPSASVGDAGSDGAGAVLGLGVGVTAYVLGMRHAFDADHIAAIDITTRRLAALGRPSSSVGLWFSLGHSTIVFVMCAALALGLQAAGAWIADDDSTLHRITGVWGPVFSALFLLAVGAANASSLRRLVGSPRGPVNRPRGPMTAVLDRFGIVVDRPKRMYGVGLLFGLGFDTATEVGLLVLAGTASVASTSWYAVLTLPILFAAGMTCLDTVQGALMGRAYRSAARANTTVDYAAVITALSCVIAFVVAVAQLGEVASALAGGSGDIGVDVSILGIALTVVVAFVWLLASVHKRLRR